MTTQDLLIFGVIMLARIIAPLFIPRFPLPGVIASLVLDAVDQTVFQTFTTIGTPAWYQGYDKAFDIYYLTIAFLATYRNWENIVAFNMSRFLYFFRLVGVVLFESTGFRALLLLFPNTFEYFFIAIEGIRTKWNIKRMAPVLVVLIAFAIWVFIKVPQEYWIHIAKLDFTDAVRKAAGNDPTLLFVLIVVLLLLAVVVKHILNQSLPPADWSFRIQVRPEDLDVTDEEVRAAAQRSAATFFDEDLITKLAMVVLVTTIFSHVLPGMDPTALQLMVGIGTVVLISTAVSEWLARKGHSAKKTIMQFLVMFVVNGAAIVGLAWLLPGSFFDIDFGGLGNYLFIVGLISLIVSFYDRFQPYYAARFVKYQAEMVRRKEIEAKVNAMMASGD